MEIKKSFKKEENEFLLVSVKSKTDQSSGVYVVEKSSIGAFIASNLTSETVILIDSVDTFVASAD